jgi:hypothetical protein
MVGQQVSRLIGLSISSGTQHAASHPNAFDEATRNARSTFDRSELLFTAHDGELDVVQIVAISALRAA